MKPSTNVEAGFVAMLTANSFMKREFGAKLIEEFFPTVDLTHVIDTSGAYIPGHGTPTCILLGRNRPPAKDEVRAILGVKGEPKTPDDPSEGLVWQSILGHMYGLDRKKDGFDRILDWSKNRESGDLLGELYQANSSEARKGRALVQTPPFARVLLMRETLGRSFQTFGPLDSSFCDPACGTGHLLVDAFRSLFGAIAEAQPHLTRVDVAREALDRVYGVDLDPCCIAISRYRLIQAAWDLVGWDGITFATHVYVGDSLLHHRPQRGDDLDEELCEVLAAGRFTAVAANPPYITVKDQKKRDAYRAKYPSAYGKYSLGCPFTELCFGIARRQDQEALPAVGDALPIYPTQQMLFDEKTRRWFDVARQRIGTPERKNHEQAHESR